MPRRQYYLLYTLDMHRPRRTSYFTHRVSQVPGATTSPSFFGRCSVASKSLHESAQRTIRQILRRARYAEAIDELIAQWRNIYITLILRRANIVVTVNEHIVGTGGLGWIGLMKSDGKLIGDAGIMLDPDWRGKGYAYETLCMVIDHGFRTLCMEEIHLACVDANSAFKGLMNTRFGFEAAPIQDKMFGNEWIWRIKRNDWYVSRHCAEGQVKKEER
jgi:RimJ/RimL family protein N-acetyltransferase